MGDHLFIKIGNINGPSTDPWGPPDVTGTECECSPSRINLLQVDLLASRVSLFWPRSGLFRREAADRERQSRERSTCLACRVFIRISRQKWPVA